MIPLEEIRKAMEIIIQVAKVLIIEVVMNNHLGGILIQILVLDKILEKIIDHHHHRHRLIVQSKIRNYYFQ